LLTKGIKVISVTAGSKTTSILRKAFKIAVTACPDLSGIALWQ